MSTPAEQTGFRGPRCWAISAATGGLIGVWLTVALPATYHDGHMHVPLWLVAPFAMLLLSIAAMPFINARAWHLHFPDFAFFLGSLTAAYYLLGFREPDAHSHGLPAGSSAMMHSALEYYAFIALVGGLYVVSGGIQVRVRGRGTIAANTLLLGVGAVLANVVGTTGASMLLIRPFMRMNKGRLRPIHVVLFIFIVSNCGGCLTPIGDPPLYLGYLKGVPFFWTLEHLWPNWLLVNGLLLGVFYAIDRWMVGRGEPIAGPLPRAGEHQGTPVAPMSIRGTVGLACLALMILGVFIDPLLSSRGVLRGVPVGATFQILVAVAAWRLGPRDILAANEFTFFPVKEVGLLFMGIFATMTPALGYLSVHGPGLGITTPTAFYFVGGSLSAVLDNAPTYLNFLQIAFANPELNPAAPGDTAITADTFRRFLFVEAGADRTAGVKVLDAVSAGAVFFGAMTYIGNGPNFMVKAIAEASGVRMPSFFAYLILAVVILLPILILNWLVLIR
ncbi:MAG: sodium:proton antiporter [Phycisphaerales bacterium]